MLGVAPGASQDELRAAYRRKAFELHPDRARGTSGSDPATRPEDRMAELNAAWQLVGDPARRREFDRRAAGQPSTGPPVPPAPRVAWTPPHTNGATAPSVAAVLAGILPWVALVVVLGAIFVFTAYAGGPGDDEPDDPASPGATVVVRDVRGSCIREADGFTLVVNCAAAPHDGRIVAQGSLDATCPAGTTGVPVPQEDFLACIDPQTAAP